jgi:hypothetical protein
MTTSADIQHRALASPGEHFKREPLHGGAGLQHAGGPPVSIVFSTTSIEA